MDAEDGAPEPYYDDSAGAPSPYYYGYGSAAGAGVQTMGLVDTVSLFVLFPFRVVRLALLFVWSVVEAILQLFMLMWTYRAIVLLIMFTWGLSYVWVNNYPAIMKSVEHEYRCYIRWAWVTWFEHVFALARDLCNESLCWTNALMQINRILNTSLLIHTFGKCEEAGTFHFFHWLRTIGGIVTDIIVVVFRWAFTINPFQNSIPVFDILNRTLTELIPETNDGVECLCKDVGFVTMFFTRIVASPNVACIGYQMTNAIVNYYQSMIEFFLDFLTMLRTAIFGGVSHDDFVGMMKGEVPGDVAILKLSKANMLERVNAAAVYLGLFLDDVFAIAYCSFVAEIDAYGDDSLVDTLFAACMADPANRPCLFCSVGTLVSVLNRALKLASTFLWHVPQIIKESVSRPVGSRWLIDVWYKRDWQIVFSTIRDPPARYNYAASLNFPTLDPLFNGTSAIKWPNNFLYGQAARPNCNLYNNSRFDIPCEQCPVVAEESVKSCLCRTAASLDNLTEPLISIVFWKPALCCLTSNLAIAVTEIANYLVGVGVHVFNYDRFWVFVADQNHYDLIFNAAIGPHHTMGGVLGCFNDIVKGVDTRLEPLSLLVTTAFKSAGEGIRLFVIGLIRLANTIAGTSEPGFNSYVCITDTNNCVDLERSLGWVRRPRLNTIMYNPNYNYTAVSSISPKASIDHFCYWLDYQILAAFTSYPAAKLPDICCIPNYTFRAIVEYVKATVEVIISDYETFRSLLEPSVPYQSAFILWAACHDLATCNNFGSLLADLEDLLNCPCEMILEIESLVSPGKNDFYCFCTILAGGAKGFSSLIRSGAAFFSVAFEMLKCISLNFPAPKCSTELALRMHVSFKDLKKVTQSVSEAAAGFGCLMGLPWVGIKVDCQGTTYGWPLDYPTCNTSHNSILGKPPCTMSDRLQMLFYYVGQLVKAVLDFVVDRIQSVLDYGLKVVIPGHLTLESGMQGSCDSIQHFLLEVGFALFGRGDQVVGNTLVSTNYTQNTSSFRDPTILNKTLQGLGVNATLFYAMNPGAGSDPYPYMVALLGGYDPPTSLSVYSSVLNFTSLANVTVTTGLIQAMGYTINCLLGPPTGSCKGPLTFNATKDPGNSLSTGCFGVLLVIGGNDFRSFWPLGVKVINDLCKLLTDLIKADAGAFLSDLLSLVVDTFDFLGAFLGSTSGIILAVTALIESMSGFLFGDAVQALYTFGRYALAGIFPSYQFGTMFEQVAAYFGNKKRVQFDDAELKAISRLLVQSMTDGTYCKRSMEILLTYDTLSLANEAIWNACYFLAGLPIVIANQTNNRLILPPDIFYNLDTMLPVIANALELFETYMRHRTSATGSSVITEMVKVPEAILSYADAQLSIQELVQGVTDEQLRTFGIILSVPNITSEDFIVQAISQIQYNLTADGHVASYKKRGWVDALTGTALEDNIIYDAHKSADGDPFDPFYQTNLKLYASMQGGLILNVTNLNRLLPVLDGKVAIDHHNVSFWEYMQRTGLNSSLNTYLVETYEQFELKQLQEQFLRFDAKASYFNELFNNYTNAAQSWQQEESLFNETIHAGADTTASTPSSATIPFESMDAYVKRQMRSHTANANLPGIQSGDSSFEVLQSKYQQEWIFKTRWTNKNRMNRLGGVTNNMFHSTYQKLMVLFPMFNIKPKGASSCSNSGPSSCSNQHTSSLNGDTPPDQSRANDDYDIYGVIPLVHRGLSYIYNVGKDTYRAYQYQHTHISELHIPESSWALPSSAHAAKRVSRRSASATTTATFDKRLHLSNRDMAQVSAEAYISLLNAKHEYDIKERERQGLNTLSNYMVEVVPTTLKHVARTLGAFFAFNPTSSSSGTPASKPLMVGPHSQLFLNRAKSDLNSRSFHTYDEATSKELRAIHVDTVMQQSAMRKRRAENGDADAGRTYDPLNLTRSRDDDGEIDDYSYYHPTAGANDGDNDDATGKEWVFVDEHGSEYSPNDEVYVVYSPAGGYETFSQITATPVRHNFHNPLNTHNPEQDHIFTQSGDAFTMHYVHPEDGIEHHDPQTVPGLRYDPQMYHTVNMKAFRDWKQHIEQESLVFHLGVNYYEKHYRGLYTNQKCADDIMWKEYWVFHDVATNNATAKERTEDGVVQDKISILDENELKAYFDTQVTDTMRDAATGATTTNSPNSTADTGSRPRLQFHNPRDIVLTFHKCYRQKRFVRETHPHQAKYGHILRGQGLFEHRWEMFTNAMSVILTDISQKLNLDTIRAKFIERHVRPWQNKYKQYVTRVGRPPKFAAGATAYEHFRKQIFKDDTTLRIPDLLWAEMGHTVTFFDQTTGKRITNPTIYEREFNQWKKAEWDKFLGYPIFAQPYPSLALEDSGEGAEIVDTRPNDATGAPKRAIGASGVSKRGHFPPLVDICLPHKENVTTCGNCKGCVYQDETADSQCSQCALCTNCTAGVGSYYDCKECGDCRVGGPYCSGDCYQCTDCETDAVCLDCILIQTVLSGIEEAVYFCYRLKILEDDSVISRPPPGTPFIKIIYLPENSTAPRFDDYGFFSLPNYFGDLLIWGIDKLAGGIDLVETIKFFVLNTNHDPARGPIGLWFSIRQLPIPCVGRCIRDVNLQCTYGTGLRDGLIASTIIVIVAGVIVMVLMPFPFNIILNAIGIPPLWLYLVGLISWMYNPVCLQFPFYGIFNLLGISMLVFPGFPVCAANEVYTLLNDTITPFMTFFIPPSFYVTANGTLPTNCSQYIIPPNCSAYGFTSGYTTLGYIGQRWFPATAKENLVTYINSTALVSGRCDLVLGLEIAFVFAIMLAFNIHWIISLIAALALGLGLGFGLGLSGTCPGILAPVYAYNFDADIADNPGLMDDCFWTSLPSIITLGFYLLVFALILWIIIRMLTLFWGHSRQILQWRIIAWLLP